MEFKDIDPDIEGICLGSFYFEAFTQLRNSMLTSVLLYNLEASNSLTKADMKSLEKVDLQLIKKVTMLSNKSSHTLIYLELGLESMEYMLKKKMIVFLQHMLKSENSSIMTLKDLYATFEEKS